MLNLHFRLNWPIVAFRQVGTTEVFALTLRYNPGKQSRTNLSGGPRNRTGAKAVEPPGRARWRVCVSPDRLPFNPACS